MPEVCLPTETTARAVGCRERGDRAAWLRRQLSWRAA
jgi:hypothetical protein